MKKKLMMFILCVVGATAVNAQVYLEGSVGLTSNKYKSDNNSTTVTNYIISPSIGYYLSEKFDIGLGVGYAKVEGDDDSEFANAKLDKWQIAPFARYSFATLGKFELLGKAAINIGSSKTTSTSYNGNESSTTWFNYGINFYPVVAFNLNDHITFLSTLNFASLGYNVSEDQDSSSRISTFGFGVDSGNVVNTSNFQIGFMYKF